MPLFRPAWYATANIGPAFSDSRRHVFTDSVHVRKFPCLTAHADPVTVACSSYHDLNTLTKSRDIGDGTQSVILTIDQINIWFISRLLAAS